MSDLWLLAHTNLCPCHPQTKSQGLREQQTEEKPAILHKTFPHHVLSSSWTLELCTMLLSAASCYLGLEGNAGTPFKASSQSNQTYFQSRLVAAGGSSVTYVLSEHHPPAVNSIGCCCCCSLKEQQMRHKPNLSPGPCLSRDSGDRDCKNVTILRLKSCTFCPHITTL